MNYFDIIANIIAERTGKEVSEIKPVSTFSELGIDSLDTVDLLMNVEAVDGKRRLAAEKVQCDLYDYLSRKEEYAQLFKGSYLSNYSWGENTLGELLNR